MNTHTLGPWRVENGLTSGDVVIVDKYALPVALCPTYGAGAVPSNWIAPWHLAGPNAKLIAAAPELLSACQMALAQMRFACRNRAPEYQWKEIAICERAIAKATVQS